MRDEKQKQLEAFCAVCPDAQEVTSVLKTLGFSLVFEMSEKHSFDAALLPAQYHYEDTYGTQVLYLAGKDVPDDETIHYPLHASRWWVYPGANQDAYHSIAHVLASHWFLLWFSSRDVAGQHAA